MQGSKKKLNIQFSLLRDNNGWKTINPNSYHVVKIVLKIKFITLHFFNE